MKVSLFEISYKKKWTFSPYSNFLDVLVYIINIHGTHTYIVQTKHLFYMWLFAINHLTAFVYKYIFRDINIFLIAYYIVAPHFPPVIQNLLHKSFIVLIILANLIFFLQNNTKRLCKGKQMTCQSWQWFQCKCISTAITMHMIFGCYK